MIRVVLRSGLEGGSCRERDKLYQDPGSAREDQAFPTDEKGDKIDPGAFDQLFDYFLLARNQRQTHPEFPEIRRVGLYFARHGYLWVTDVAEWTGRSDFAETEQWLLAKAKQCSQEREERVRRLVQGVTRHPDGYWYFPGVGQRRKS
jgi:hypothetical protein